MRLILVVILKPIRETTTVRVLSLHIVKTEPFGEFVKTAHSVEKKSAVSLWIPQCGGFFELFGALWTS